jgi:hypothetical protein
MKKSLFILFSLLLSYSISAQKLRIFGEVQQEINLDTQSLSKYPSSNFEVKDKDQSKTYNVVGVYELFKAAGVTLGVNCEEKVCQNTSLPKPLMAMK